jgi:site-specific recombinase XerD
LRRLINAAGIGAGASSAPRLHDLRHTFAVRTLLRWYRTGEDVQAKPPLLSTYLGHREPASTYWYLSAAPELLSLAAARQDTGALMTLIAPTLQMFFTDRLAQQRQPSPRTITGYRDALKLLLEFIHARDRQATLPAGLGGPGRDDDLRIPHASGDHERQQRQDPERPD